MAATKYIVIEIQTNANGTVGNLVTAHDTLDEGYSKFYAVLSAAAISTIPIHTAILVENNGYVHAKNSFTHADPNAETDET